MLRECHMKFNSFVSHEAKRDCTGHKNVLPTGHKAVYLFGSVLFI